MSKITLTIEGEDWADVGLQLIALTETIARQPAPTQLPAPTPLPMQDQASVSEGPAGQCPKHLKPWRTGNKGPYCSAKDESGFNGYCSLRPGDVYNGRRAVA